VAHDIARQRRIQRLAAALGALVAGTSTLSSSVSAAAGWACAPSISASLKNRSFWCAALTSLLASKSWRLKRLSCSLSRSRSVRTTRNAGEGIAAQRCFFSASQ
jgi:hypothetical protein